MKKIIGRKARYIGKEQNLDAGVVIGVIRAEEVLRDDREVAETGGVKPKDRVEFRPIHPDGRPSWITCDPLFKDVFFID